MTWIYFALNRPIGVRVCGADPNGGAGGDGAGGGGGVDHGDDESMEDHPLRWGGAR
jgi:hypothetical protein